ncbi:hypothetical protein DPMN_048106 [Dreissena polymorpha]|uniref:Uncharacterized protein n=1 Tax=Dreissena polymorpha TaxID=45954 RepID=A0A9D4DBN5_DREPO|nr:hypothetical protein DPMN_048106 [Dreissena polymorpha]
MQASRVLTRKTAPPPWWPYIIGTNLWTKFHEDRKINVASRVLTRKNAPPPGGHIFQPTGIIFELFNEDRTINVAPIVKNALPLGSHVFQVNATIFKLIQDIIGPLPGGYVFKATETIFKLIQDIIGTNLLTKFHEDQKINVASRVLTRFYFSLLGKMPCPLGHVFQPSGNVFKLVQDIIGMNLQTRFHEDRTINVASRSTIYSHVRKNAPPLGSHVFQANTNLLTKFHEDRKINVASKVLTRQMLTPHEAQRTTDKRRSQKLTMSTLCSDNFQSKFHEDWANRFNNTCSFEFGSDIIWTYKLSKFQEDWEINVANFQTPTRHYFLTKLNEDWAIDVASRVLTSSFL